MTSDVTSFLIVFFLVNLLLFGGAALALKWKFRKKRWKTDEEILAEQKAIHADLASRGESRDLWDDLSKAIAIQNWKKAKEFREARHSWAPFLHWLGQMVVAGFAWVAYSEDNLKLFVLLALFFLLRSLKYHADRHEQIQILISEHLHMAHPAAEEDFFKSEHCYDSDIHRRAWELLDKGGYFPRK